MSTTQQQSGASNPFISIFESLGNTLTQSATQIGTQVLPVWVANQLELEMRDGTYQPVFDRRNLPPTVDQVQAQSPSILNVGGLTGNKVGDIVIIGGLLVLGTVLIFKA